MCFLEFNHILEHFEIIDHKIHLNKKHNNENTI